jgi:hypothetical protein
MAHEPDFQAHGTADRASESGSESASNACAPGFRSVFCVCVRVLCVYVCVRVCVCRSVDRVIVCPYPSRAAFRVRARSPAWHQGIK